MEYTITDFLNNNIKFKLYDGINIIKSNKENKKIINDYIFNGTSGKEDIPICSSIKTIDTNNQDQINIIDIYDIMFKYNNNELIDLLLGYSEDVNRKLINLKKELSSLYVEHKNLNLIDIDNNVSHKDFMLFKDIILYYNNGYSKIGDINIDNDLIFNIVEYYKYTRGRKKNDTSILNDEIKTLIRLGRNHSYFFDMLIRNTITLKKKRQIESKISTCINRIIKYNKYIGNKLFDSGVIYDNNKVIIKTDNGEQLIQELELQEQLILLISKIFSSEIKNSKYIYIDLFKYIDDTYYEEAIVLLISKIILLSNGKNIIIFIEDNNTDNIEIYNN